MCVTNDVLPEVRSGCLNDRLAKKDDLDLEEAE